MSVDDTDESMEVENILDDLNNSDGGSDDCCLADEKAVVDEDFPSYKSVVLNSKTDVLTAGKNFLC